MTHRHLVAVLFLAALPACAQPCEAPANVKAAIAAATLAPTGSMDDRVAAARKLRDQFPADYFAHKFYQELFVKQGLFSPQVQEEYRALLDTHPEDLTYLALYARTLKGTNTPAALNLLDKILDSQPDHAQAHLKLVEIYAAPAFRNDTKLAAHVTAYFELCPSSLSAFPYIARIDDAQFVRTAAAHLRELLDSRSDADTLPLYNMLWTLEFKATPLAEQETARARVRTDVEKLRALDPSKYPFLLGELGQAFKILGDAAGSKWVDEQLPRNGALRASGIAEAISEWHRAHPYKNGFEREAFQAILLKQSEAWVLQWPEDPQPRYERFLALRANQDAPLEDLIKAAEDWLRVYEAHPAFVSPYLQVAQLYASHNLRYSELPGLLEKALKPVATAPTGSVSDLYVSSSQSRRAQHYSSWSNTASAAGIYLKIAKYDEAQALLSSLGDSLLKEKPADSDPEQDKRQYRQFEYLYWNNMTKLARARGNKLEALTYDRNGMLSDPNLSTNPTFQQYRVSSLLDAWKEIHEGSETGFEDWMAKTAAASSYAAVSAPKAPLPTVAATQSAWTSMDKPLPDFQISDAEGKTWRLADLQGKVVLINLWATWCGPCRTELPYLQQLFNQVRERKDLLVITLNTDENPGLIMPFLDQNKFTFPVLPASGYVSKLVPELSIPRNWIVDARGVLKLEQIGFNPIGDQWIKEMVGVMEKARTNSALK